MPGKRKRSKKWDRCVRKVRRRKPGRRGKKVNPYAVCTAQLKPDRRRNPRTYGLYAQPKKGTKVTLKYLGGIKFGKRGQPVKFLTQRHAETIKKQLLDHFAHELAGFKLWVA